MTTIAMRCTQWGHEGQVGALRTNQIDQRRSWSRPNVLAHLPQTSIWNASTVQVGPGPDGAMRLQTARLEGDIASEGARIIPEARGSLIDNRRI